MTKTPHDCGNTTTSTGTTITMISFLFGDCWLPFIESRRELFTAFAVDNAFACLVVFLASSH